MTIEELIKELRKYPSDLDVYVSQKECEYCNTLKEVELDEIDGVIVLNG